ncbi:hypothetical protein [Endozoicomonas sp. GU-1]|uniref:hypothetical protein n=1 Tax=Endozoicomonas sp. GU-1 TaxID=3009078 RepID=UPI0022B5529B|nr:hypothetical protein [Endozoicomonas sp. GU-1]WBA86752.1 hypothetical protein O3276_01525 [Endozoicomonas sp. GU-1]
MSQPRVTVHTPASGGGGDNLGTVDKTKAVNSFVNGHKKDFGSISNDQLLCQNADPRVLTANCSSRTGFRDALDLSVCPVNAAKESTPTTASTAAKESTPTTASTAAKESTPTTASTAAKESTPTTATTAAKESTPTTATTAAKESTPTTATTAAKESTTATASTAAKESTPTTASTPIKINDAENLGKIGRHPDYPLNGAYQQTADIVVTKDYQSIGNHTHPFTGEFDGQCRTISGLSDCFVDTLQGSIRNLNFTGADINSHKTTGLAACVVDDTGTVSNIWAENVHIVNSGDAKAGIGGGVGLRNGCQHHGGGQHGQNRGFACRRRHRGGGGC